MSQDKSREFLHSGNDKDKFKVFSSFSFLLIPLYQYVCFPKIYFMHWNICGLMDVNEFVVLLSGLPMLFWSLLDVFSHVVTRTFCLSVG
jgi:hypothetical protein